MAAEPVKGAALASLSEARAATNQQGRDDLRRRLDEAEARLADPQLTVVVAGEFKQGKSSLVNALLNASVCPVDDDIATAVPTVLRYSETPWGRANHLPPPEGGEGEVEEFEVDLTADYASEAGNPRNRRGLQSVELGIPRKLLAEGLVLVDTPGVGGLDSAHGAITIGVLPVAEALVFVTDASQEMSATEVEFLQHAVGLCPNIVHVVTKIDLYPHWRTIVDRDREHLQATRLPGSLLPVSSVLRSRAAEENDSELNEESGFPALIDYLRRDILGAAEAVAASAAMADVRSVLDQLAQAVSSEKAALESPEQASAVMGDLDRAQRRAEDLRSQSARWQLTLNDGIGDLNADTDFDLRNRMRIVTREAEESINAGDPADMWEEFEAWLYKRVTAEVVENFSQLATRVTELIDSVEEHFAVAETQLQEGVETGSPLSTLDNLDVKASVEASKQSIGAATLTALRGSYGGVLMFSMIANMVGLAAMNPAVLVVGLLMGGKSLREERQRQLTQRRQQAMTAMRKYVDEVSFRVGKDSRDSLRKVQRDLRDLFTDRAEELQRSTKEALDAAQRAAKTDQAEHQGRIAELDKQLDRLQAVRRQAIRIGERASGE